MPKMRKFKFDDGNEVKEVEALSFKKAVKSFQGNSKAKMVTIEWTTKAGEEFVKEQKLPLGRKKKIGRQKTSESKQEPISQITSQTKNVLRRCAWPSWQSVGL